MTHEDRDQLDSRLNDYLDEDLSTAERAEVEAHLATCEPCRQELASLRSLAAESARIVAAVTPARDLWPGIVARLPRAGATPRARGRQLVAAGWLAGLAAAAAVLLLVMPRAPDRAAAVVALPPDGGRRVATALDDLAAAEREYQEAAMKLSAALVRNQDVLPAESRAAIEQSLAVIDAALVETRVALARDPENLRMALMLSKLHQEKVALLRAATRIADFGEKG